MTLAEIRQVALEASLEAFSDALVRENRTLKRALTDPRVLSGIGNAHSDEILLRARLSPLQLTRNLTPDEIDRLRDAAQASLREWVDRLRAEFGERFPERITAFHPDMAAHGKDGHVPRIGHVAPEAAIDRLSTSQPRRTGDPL